MIFGVYSLALVLLLATDLDQRLLPNEITLPAIPLAFLVSLLGLNPLVAPPCCRSRRSWRVVDPGDPVRCSRCRSAPGRSARATSSCWSRWGCSPGPLRMFSGVVYGALLAGIVIVVLLVLRRITLKTFIPFGPFLIIGALWAILVLE